MKFTGAQSRNNRGVFRLQISTGRYRCRVHLDRGKEVNENRENAGLFVNCELACRWLLTVHHQAAVDF